MIENQGNAPSSPCTAELSLNTSDEEEDEDSTTLVSDIGVPSIPSGDSSSIYLYAIVPTDATAGSHFLWFHVDVDDEAGQSDHSNDRAHQPFEVDPPLPADLIVYDVGVDPEISVETYPETDCAVIEGCAQAGTRTLLRFNAEAHNIGAGDLVLGNPIGNPLFYYSPCHNHYHLRGFMSYRLLDGKGQAATGYKEAFCLLDTVRFDSHASTIGVYGCDYQGLQSGWGDIYSASLPCQFIDITGVAPGNYTLEMEVNPYHEIPEADYGNNITTVPVLIPGATPTPIPVPVNDSIPIANTIPQTLAPGQSVGIGMTFKNTGNTTWTAQDNYALNVADDPCGIFENSLISIRDSDAIPPNQTYEFLAQIQGPMMEGTCGVKLKMRLEPLGFGQELDADILISPPANTAKNWAVYE